MMSTILSVAIPADIQAMYNPSEYEYLLYLKDHRDEITKNSDTQYISITEQYEYKYRLRMYLKSIEYPEEFDWYVLWLNRLDTTMDFHDLPKILLPKVSYITSLRSIYRAERSQRKKCNLYISQ